MYNVIIKCLFKLKLLYDKYMKNKLMLIIVSLLLSTSSTFGVLSFIHDEAKKEIDANFHLNGSENVVIDYGYTYKDEGYTINIDDKIPNVIVENNINLEKVGNYTITYTVNYRSYKKTLTRNVKIVDNEAPMLEVDSKDDVYLEVNKEFITPKYTVTDNYDKNLEATIENNVNSSKVGDYKVKYTVFDSSNNKSEKIINVHVKNKKDLNYIVVSISKQKLEYYENGELSLTTPVTTGRHNATPKGNFKVLKKVKNATLKGANYSSFVKYWMAFKGNSFGIHDASWRRNFGNMNYYNNGSHGCINVPLKAVEKLFNKVEVGTPVYVKD